MPCWCALYVIVVCPWINRWRSPIGHVQRGGPFDLIQCKFHRLKRGVGFWNIQSWRETQTLALVSHDWKCLRCFEKTCRLRILLIEQTIFLLLNSGSGISRKAERLNHSTSLKWDECMHRWNIHGQFRKIPSWLLGAFFYSVRQFIFQYEFLILQHQRPRESFCSFWNDVGDFLKRIGLFARYVTSCCRWWKFIFIR